MKTNGGHTLLALCLAIFAASSQVLHGAAAPEKSSAAFEQARIKAGLDKIGVAGGYEIVVGDACDPVENTAAKVMQRFLAKASLAVGIVPESKASGAKRIILGRESNLKAIRELGDKGTINIRDVSAEDDGFHLKRIGRDIVIAGANPRGVLYGVYALEDFINDGAAGPVDLKQVPHYRKRSNTVGYYFNGYIGEFTRADAEYLSRLRVNQYASCDGSGVMSHLHELIKSDVFPFQNPPIPDYQRKVKTIAALCKEYGIDYYLMLWEPIVPQLGADIGKYPPEALGRVKRPWGGDKDGMDRTLCLNSPIVQQHYRSLVKNFVREYADVKGFFFYNLDGATWLCTPGLCERCAKAVKDSPHDLFNPWETQSLLVSLLADAAHGERPDFKLNFWGDVHFHGEGAEKLLAHAQGYDALSSGWDGSDHDIMITEEKGKPCAEFRMTQAAARERGVPMYVYFAYNRLESVPQGFPFPFHVCASLKKFKEWGASNLVEVTGPTPALNPINALVMKEFQRDPDQDPAKLLSGLAVKQFGAAAGPLMFKAWGEIKVAMDGWNGYALTPLSGSQGFLSIGTLFGVPRPILPEIAKDFDYQVDLRIVVEPWRKSDYLKFKEPAFLDKMKQMNVHLAKAEEHARQAVAAANDREFIGICYYEGAKGRPTQKEYAESNHASIALANALCRQRVNIIRAYHLLTEMEAARTAGDEKSAQAKERLYLDLVGEDIALQERFGELLAGFAKMQPCEVRTSLTEREIADRLSDTRDKIGKLKAFLTSKGG